MSLWLSLAILAPLLFGLTHPIDAGLRRNYIKNDLSLMWFFGASHLPLAILLFIFVGISPSISTTNLLMLLAGSFWTLPSIFYFWALKFESPSRVALILQFIPLFTLIIAFLFIQELLNIRQISAFAVIFVGGILAAIKFEHKSWHFSKAFWLVGFASLLWASSNVMFKYYQDSYLTYLEAFSYYFLGSSLPAVILYLIPQKRKKILKGFKKLPLKAWSLLIFNRIASLSGSVCLTLALTFGAASLTSVITGTQPLFAFIFSIILSKFFKEIPAESIEKSELFIKGVALLVIIGGLLIFYN